ncbi:coiled-coil domain-containing protein 27 isoform X2 [Melanerpes formicivorus]|uniref:coiled-coil domain-containing protein 27 isoform X2 n=1 Tax=Melanerpes formicivorus TaxID=211600 RepID=UPI00358FCF3D
MEAGGAGGAAAQDTSQELPAAELPQSQAELRERLRRAEEEYSTATGALCSLHRQLELQESQLRSAAAEREMLQKQLREREKQLQAMSSKFCSLREERKHQGMLVAMEQENCSLRQLVTEQGSQLAEQNKLLSELQGTVSQLQAEVLASQRHLQNQQQAQEELQAQAERLQHRELQTRVALEQVTSRFDRFRSQILQATFSTAGSKAPQAELSDQQVLEAMQIISEWGQLQQLVPQDGAKVPSRHSSDLSLASPSARGRRKSSVK